MGVPPASSAVAGPVQAAGAWEPPPLHTRTVGTAGGARARNPRPGGPCQQPQPLVALAMPWVSGLGAWNPTSFPTLPKSFVRACLGTQTATMPPAGRDDTHGPHTSTASPASAAPDMAAAAGASASPGSSCWRPAFRLQRWWRGPRRPLLEEGAGGAGSGGESSLIKHLPCAGPLVGLLISCCCCGKEYG